MQSVATALNGIIELSTEKPEVVETALRRFVVAAAGGPTSRSTANLKISEIDLALRLLDPAHTRLASMAFVTELASIQSTQPDRYRTIAAMRDAALALFRCLRDELMAQRTRALASHPNSHARFMAAVSGNDLTLLADAKELDERYGTDSEKEYQDWLADHGTTPSEWLKTDAADRR